MTTVEKITVSLPAELLARIEGRRLGGARSRSEVVSELLWRGWHQVETEAREEQYRAAYGARPETDEEGMWADRAAADLFTEDTGWGIDANGPDDTGRRHRPPYHGQRCSELRSGGQSDHPESAIRYCCSRGTRTGAGGTE